MFFVKLKHSNAYLSYTKPQRDTMDLKETHVPIESRKKGVGTALVNHVLEFAREESMKIIPSCPFVEEYIHEHPDYKNLLPDDAMDTEIKSK
jgi:hypothetical protein